MELQEREKEILGFYAFVSSMLSKSERVEARKGINKDLSNLLEEEELNEEEYNTMQKELDELDKLP